MHVVLLCINSEKTCASISSLLALQKSTAAVLPGQRAFPQGDGECNRDSRHTGGCGFGGMGAGAMSLLNDGQRNGLPGYPLTMRPGAPLLQ